MAETCEARARLNTLLGEVVSAARAAAVQAEVFDARVPVEQIADYHLWVDPSNGNADICLELIARRTREGFYGSAAELRRDYELILANSLAYNSPGHGRHAYKPIIGWSQDLLECCCKELAARKAELSSAEKDLKVR